MTIRRLSRARRQLLWLAAFWSGLVQAQEPLVASGLDELGDPSLSAAIVAYYQAEKAHDWQTTYALRGPRFATVVPLDNYARQMDNDALGWELIAIEGRTVLVEGTLAQVTLSFQEDLSPEVAQRLLGPELASPVQSGQGQRYSQPEVTQWLLQDGQWLALTPGARRHFVFNERLVWD
jgi:hypothetical protein